MVAWAAGADEGTLDDGTVDADGVTSIGGRDGNAMLAPGSAATIVGSTDADGSAAETLPV